ncbi:MAG: hypothetical protein NTZ51_11545 [Proteobacteria bacterium]|nr:hypothetical protein [Pseudomonadota bacterium]
MKKAEITITFDLENKRDKRIYTGMMNLPKHFGGTISEAFMFFFDSVIVSLGECEERKQQCEKLLIQIADVSVGKKEGHA